MPWSRIAPAGGTRTAERVWRMTPAKRGQCLRTGLTGGACTKSLPPLGAFPAALLRLHFLALLCCLRSGFLLRGFPGGLCLFRFWLGFGLAFWRRALAWHARRFHRRFFGHHVAARLIRHLVIERVALKVVHRSLHKLVNKFHFVLLWNVVE